MFKADEPEEVKAETLPATQQQAPLAIRKSSELLAQHLGMETPQMIAVIKAQCFKGSRPQDITTEQLAVYVNTANALRKQAPNFNPLLTGMLYAYPSKNGGIEPMIGPDGVYALLGSREDVVSHREEAEFDEDGNLVSAVAYIEVRGKGQMEKRVWFDEWVVESNPNWKKRPRHMLELRALKQCARKVIHGIPMDSDEMAIMEGTDKLQPKERPAIPPPPASKSAGRASQSANKPKNDPAPAEKAENPTEAKHEPSAGEPEAPHNGGAAHAAGFDRDKNPFPADAPEREEWNKEWDAAEALS